jgi:hypothetical protein
MLLLTSLWKGERISQIIIGLIHIDYLRRLKYFIIFAGLNNDYVTGPFKIYKFLPLSNCLARGKLLTSTICTGLEMVIASDNPDSLSIIRSRSQQPRHSGISSSNSSSCGESTVARITTMAGLPHKQRKGLVFFLRALFERQGSHRPSRPPK